MLYCWGENLWYTCILFSGGVAILSDASCYRILEHFHPCWSYSPCASSSCTFSTNEPHCSNLRDQPYTPPLHLTAFFTHTVCCLEIWIWRKQLERRRAHTCTAVKTYKPFSSRKGGSTVQVLNLYLWPFHIYLLRSQHIECIAWREPSFNSDSTSKTDENSWWCQKNPKSKSCSWLHESSWKQVEQFAKFIFTS